MVTYINVDGKNYHYASTIGFLAIFFASIYLHKYFFPFLTAASSFYVAVETQSLWNEDYKYMLSTTAYRFLGDMFLIAAMIDFALKMIFKYKIIKK